MQRPVSELQVWGGGSSNIKVKFDGKIPGAHIE